ncbi:hypothetical protein LI951_14895 [Enterococcus sp. BWT-B8]|uniref:D-alanyl-D-alanine carboxypeptidase family protein n=1 Tax=Enterococcus sp. BWT-B8 TaxID=2885157 RepID=UPI001E461207|nr:hypothetical protein [Enterococcus sp. BWT-B8]MCB5953355.1 hypothetical protein [Enterococcus sp. BWT-B8]
MYKKRSRKLGFWIFLLSVIGLLVKADVLTINHLPFLQSHIKEVYSQNKEGIEGITAKQILLKERGGAVLYDRSSQQKTSIASLTKIMTAVCLIEAFPDTHQQVIIPSDIFPYIWEEELATAGFQQNEAVSLEAVLYGIMLPSGAEAALAGAIYAAGTEQAFVEWMNQKAKELGMNQTQFSNVTGVDSTSHFSTASDLVKLVEYALENPTFYRLFTTLTYRTLSTALQPEGLQLNSTLLMTGEALGWEQGEIIGGKTGYTLDAGQCLASLAVVNGKEYIMILLGAEGSPGSDQLNIRESRFIYQKFTRACLKS